MTEASPMSMRAAGPPPPERWRTLIAALAHGLLEREAAVRLVLLAALAGEHVLLLGPPGTAKSALARRLHRAFDGARYFERLLTRFSTPEELFGPLSLKALEHDRYERLTEGFLPTAGIAFLDEVFKANSAILNALLTLLNEREFDNGTQRVRTPLVAVVAASNESPTDEALQAFHDRFLVRVPVHPVGDASFPALLSLGDDGMPALQPLSPEERAAVQAEADRVDLGEDFAAGCLRLRAWLATHGTPLSDRRWRQFVALARTAAASEGRRTLDALDLWLVPYVASAKPEEVGALQQWFDDDAVQAPPALAPWLERAVQAFEAQLRIEESAPAEDGKDDAGKLALARALGAGREDEDGPGMLRIVSERLEARLRRRWSPVHVAARLAQIDEVSAELRAHRHTLGEQAQALAAAVRTRVWLPPSWAGRLQQRHAQALALLDALLQRLQAARAGFAALPQDELSDEPAAPPLTFDAPAAAA